MQAFVPARSAPGRNLELERKLRRMTILVGMVGPDGIILAADRLAVRPASNVGECDDRSLGCKIENLENHEVAYAGVGDTFTWQVGRALSVALDNGHIKSEKNIGRALERLAVNTIREEHATVERCYPLEEDRRMVFDENRPRALLIVFYGSKFNPPQLWSLTIHEVTRYARPVNGFVISGGIGNLARFWGSRYYKENTPIVDLKLLAAHTVLEAHRFDSSMIEGLDVAVFDDHGFSFIGQEEKAELLRKSEALDGLIRSELFKKS